MKLIPGECPECGPSAGSEWVITDRDGNVLYATRNYEWAVQYLRNLVAATQPATGDQVEPTQSKDK